jgi:YfiR/HmsC-like
MKCKIYVRLAMLISVAWVSVAIGQPTNYRFASIYIYSFTKYIDWPSFSSQDYFIIGIYGDSPVMKELLTTTKDRKVGDRTVVVKKYNSFEEIEDCQIIFVPQDKENELPEIIKLANKNHMLVITEGKNLAQKGACINLVNVEDKQKFELNENAATKAGLKISYQLFPLSIVVK